MATTPAWDDFVPEPDDPLREFPATDRITVLMEVVMANWVRVLPQMLASSGIIWNQRGPCGRKPEQVARDMGHLEAHAMLVARRERAELEAALLKKERRGARRL